MNEKRSNPFLTEDDEQKLRKENEELKSEFGEI